MYIGVRRALVTAEDTVFDLIEGEVESANAVEERFSSTKYFDINYLLCVTNDLLE